MIMIQFISLWTYERVVMLTIYLYLCTCTRERQIPTKKFVDRKKIAKRIVGKLD